MNIREHDAAVMFVFGQSNAHGHAAVMDDCDIIKEPMKNVFGLAAKDNQAYGLSEVKFSGYSSYGMNLGETQDATYRLAACFAKLWQSEIDSGNKAGLPDLYIVQISIGSQGTVYAYFWDGSKYNMMWIPDRERIMDIEHCDISLYPLALETIENTMKFLNGKYKNPVSLGLHWIGSEADSAPVDETFFDTADKYYEKFFGGLLKKMTMPCPVYFYELCYANALDDKEPKKYQAAVNAAFKRLSDRNGTFVYLPTSKNCPYFDLNAPQRGIYREDGIHYLPKVHKWFAEQLFESVIGKD